MPDSKISGLTSATTPLAGTEVLPIVQGGQTRQVSVANLTAGRSVDASTLTVTGNTFLATTSGNVGIGTTSPGYKLDIVGSGLTLARIKGGSSTNQGSAYYIEQAGSASTLFAIGDSSAITGGATDASVTLFTASSVPFIFFVGGAERMRLDSSGNVGIGTSSPGYRLDVYKAGAASISAARSDTQAVLRSEVGACAADLNVVSTYGEVRTATNHPLLFSTNATERMRITSTGDVGIGTTSPGTKLDVAGTARIQSNFFVYGSGDRLNVFPQAAGSGVQLLATNNANSAYAQLSLDGSLQIFNTNGSERMRITGSGDVGIGTSTPAVKLDVANGFAIIGANSANPGVGGNIRFRDDTGTARWLNGILGSVAATAYSIYDIVAGAERLSITSTGDVGIGTSSPAFRLDVSGAAPRIRQIATTGTNSSLIQLDNTGGTAYIGLDSVGGGLGGSYAFNMWYSGAYPIVFATNNAEKVRITSAGDVGIGTSSPASKLHVVGDIQQDNANYIKGKLAAGTATRLFGLNAANSLYIGGIDASQSETLFTRGGTTQMTLDASGNLGLGVTPSAWGVAFKAAQLTYGSIYSQAFTVIGNASNCYNNGTNWIYYSTGQAVSRYEQSQGAHAWYNAVAGTAGNAISFTQAMTLDASGNLGLGVTPQAWGVNQRVIELAGASSAHVVAYVNGLSSGTNYYINSGGLPTYSYTGQNATRYFQTTAGQHQWFNAPSGTAGNTISFTQAMTLDASGNLLVGSTSSYRGGRLVVKDVNRAQTSTTANLHVSTTDSQAADIGGSIGLGGQVGGDETPFAYISGRKENSTSGNYAGYLAFAIQDSSAAVTERMRITSTGNVGIGTSSPVNTTGYGGLTLNGTSGAIVSMMENGTETFRLTNATGYSFVNTTGSTPLLFGTAATERLRITSAGNIHTPAGATTMTNGFFYIPAAAGVPTGAATAITGTVPLYYNSSANTLYAYNSGWQAISGGLSLLSTNANGVVYLNGSSQATTSTALQFNGTELAVGITPSSGIQFEAYSTSLTQIRARTATSGVDSRLVSNSSGSLGYVGTISNHDFALYANNTEQLRINAASGYVTIPSGIVYSNLTTTTGSSIFSALTGVGYATLIRQYGSAATGTTDGVSNAGLGVLDFFTLAPGLIRTNGAQPLVFATNGTERMRITSTGLVGIGTSTISGGGLDVKNDAGGILVYAYGDTATAGNVSIVARNTDAGAGSLAQLGLWNDQNPFSGFNGTLQYYSNASTIPNEFRIVQGANAPMTFYTNTAERMRITENGNITARQPAQSAQNTSATLTIAQLRTRIITANAAVTLTLPTGTTLDTYATGMPTDAAFEVTFIAVAAAAITIGANGNTTVGSLTVAANTSGTYRFRKTAANTFTVYRL